MQCFKTTILLRLMILWVNWAVVFDGILHGCSQLVAETDVLRDLTAAGVAEPLLFLRSLVTITQHIP